MSYNELHFGRLKKVDLHGKSIEEWAKEKLKTDFPKGSIKIHQSDHLFQLLSLKINYIDLNGSTYLSEMLAESLEKLKNGK